MDSPAIDVPKRSQASTQAYCESGENGLIRPLLDERESGELGEEYPPGTRIADRYRIRSFLGNGGMGIVFLADDERLGRPVAIKLVASRSPVNTGEFEVALVTEAKLGANLNHPGIAAVYDIGMHAGKLFAVFEYVEGETLRQLLNRRSRVSLAEAQFIVATLARALDFAHGRGIVHRDLKPENVGITRGGQFKILDLGLARDLNQSASTSRFAGTPVYASPEQALCRPTDGRTDQYALGLIAFELLSGEKVFSGDDTPTLLRKHVDEPPPLVRDFCPDVPATVESAILRALEKFPQQRFATCQEFAEEFAHSTTVEQRASAGAIPFSVPESQRVSLYIGHAGEDSLSARRLASAMGQLGYTTWYYQRDALPGVSLMKQTVEAIHRAYAALLLISPQSVDSQDFAREVEEAHQANRPFLPLLVGISAEEFESRQPAWRAMLGAAAVVELDQRSFDDVIERVAAAAERLGIPRGDQPRRPPAPHSHVVRRQIWATDANQIDIDDLGSVIYVNDVIKDFLHRSNKHFLSATKGLGKTLLLTYKRFLLTRQSAADSVTLVPQSRPYLDFMSEMKSLSNKHEQPLSELNNTKRLWTAALRISAISHHADLIDEDEAFELEEFPPRIRRWMAGSKIQPTVVFKELTSLSISQFNRLVDETENFLDQKMRMIHGATYFFIDKVDQALRQLSRGAWVNIQAGLIEAGWDMMNANSHIKVYATIRQEAFSNYESHIKSNLLGATTNLQYSEDDLQNLLDHLAQCYEGCRDFKDFIGLNVIKHAQRPFPENSFGFIHRHTFGRPRDYVAIASELSSSKSSLNERRYCELVRRVSSTGLVSNVFDELQVFLDCLHDKATRLRFLAELPRNILSRQDAVEICARFNGIPAESIAQFGEDSAEIFHPFRDLYLTGVLGVLVRDAEKGIVVQKFKQPHDIVSNVGSKLPESPHYVIHPALNEFIETLRADGTFHVFQHVPTGHNLPWQRHYDEFVEIEKAALPIDDARLTAAVHRLLRQAQVILNSGYPLQLRAALESSDDWRTLCQAAIGVHDDLVLWFEELVTGGSSEN